MGTLPQCEFPQRWGRTILGRPPDLRVTLSWKTAHRAKPWVSGIFAHCSLRHPAVALFLAGTSGAHRPPITWGKHSIRLSLQESQARCLWAPVWSRSNPTPTSACCSSHMVGRSHRYTMRIADPSAVCPPRHASQEAILVHLPLKLKLTWFPMAWWGGGRGLG